MASEITIIIGKKKYTTTIQDVVEHIVEVVEQNRDAFDED